MRYCRIHRNPGGGFGTLLRQMSLGVVAGFTYGLLKDIFGPRRKGGWR